MPTDSDLGLLWSRHHRLMVHYLVQVKRIDQAIKHAIAPEARGSLGADFDTALSNLLRSTGRLVSQVPVGTSIETANGPLILAERNPDGSVILTDDGGPYLRGDWHSGPTDEVVRVERWSPRITDDLYGMSFHGYIGRTSRRLVQSG